MRNYLAEFLGTFTLVFIGPALVQGGKALEMVWIFCVGPLVGGHVGLGLYKAVYQEPKG